MKLRAQTTYCSTLQDDTEHQDIGSQTNDHNIVLATYPKMISPPSETNSAIEPILPKRSRRKYERRNSKVGKMFLEAGYSLSMMTAELEFAISSLSNKDSSDDEAATAASTSQAYSPRNYTDGIYDEAATKPCTSQASSIVMPHLTTTTTITPLSDVRSSKVRQRVEKPSAIGSKNGNVSIGSDASTGFVERIIEELCQSTSLSLKRKTYGGG